MTQDIVPTTISTGDISVTIAAPASGTMNVETQETISTTPFNIAADALQVRIKNVGPAITGGAIADITVNGYNVPVGEELVFKAEFDRTTGANGTYKKTPLLAITNPSGAGIWYQIIT